MANRILYESSCCYAALESYKDTECPECGLPCEAQPTDMEPLEPMEAPLSRDRTPQKEGSRGLA